jgi:hypothetical protein
MLVRSASADGFNQQARIRCLAFSKEEGMQRLAAEFSLLRETFLGPLQSELKARDG